MRITASTRIVHHYLTTRTLQAVDDLNSLIEKVIGVKLQVVAGFDEESLPANCIFIGVRPCVKNFFPEVNWEMDAPEKVVVTCRNNRVAIAGRDRFGLSTTMTDSNGKTLTNIQSEYGTANAIYTFAIDFLGFAFFYGTDEGMYVPDALNVPTRTIEYAPTIRDRSTFHLLRLVQNISGRAHENLWAKRVRLQYGSLDINPHHAFVHFWDKYGKSNPEIFALYNGKREPWKGMKTKVKMCYTEPALYDICLKEFDLQLAENPNITHLFVAANDGWASYHCQCERCMAWGNTKEQSKREVRFANILAAKLRERYPDKDYYVGIQAYGYSRVPPDIAPADNVHVAHVANFIQRGESEDGDQRQQMMEWYKGWAAMTPNISERPNLGNPVGLEIAFPDFDLEQLSGDFKWLKVQGCNGLWFDAIWNHWVTQMPYYYALSKLAWNPDTNYDDMMREFYKKCYGRAASNMKAFWDLIQGQRRKIMTEVPQRFRFKRAAPYFTGICNADDFS